LSHEFVQITDPAGVDTTLLENIENGTTKLTDNLFFELLSESPKYLSYEPFQEKVNLWQALLMDESVDKEVREAAKDRLQNIGNGLSFVGSGRRTKTNEALIYYKFEQLEDILKPVMDEIKSFYIGNRQQSFKEKLPAYSEYSKYLLTQKTARGLAKKIIAEKYDIDDRSVEKIISEYESAAKRTKAISHHKKLH
jgi:hypothetical protein